MKQDFSWLKKRKKIVMLTAYDFQVAKLLEEAGVDLVLVGDSLGMVVLGCNDTKGVSMQQMLHHTAAVARGVKRTPVIGDMPARSYGSGKAAVKNANRFLEAGASAVKIEGNKRKAVKALHSASVPVMGHVGLLPQTAQKYALQGRQPREAEKILADALELDSLGVFAIVLECIPAALAERITSATAVPTIGIGAGPHCNGQVLVTNDLLGFDPGFSPKFVKRYANLGKEAREAASRFREDVLKGRFPDKKHSF